MPADPGWARPPSGPIALPPGHLHVWRARLEVPAATLAELAATLSDEERARADRFRTPELAGRFVAGRGIVRRILARYTDAAPGELRFAVGERGKPALGGAHGEVRFNASNSGELTLVAVAAGREVGVDLEALRPVPEALAIADRMLAPGERERLRALPDAERETAFLHCWTRKEAYIKALGAGLWTGLDGFEVAFGSGEEPALLSVRGSAEAARRWAMRALAPGPGYVAAVVAEAPLEALRTFEWTP